MRRFSLGAAVALVLALALGDVRVIAQTPPDIYRDSRGAVYVHGATAAAAGDRLWVRYPGVPYQRNIRAGFCGEIRVAPTQAFPQIGDRFQVGGQVFEASGLPDLGRRCVNAAFSDGGAGSWRSGPVLYFAGFPPGVSQVVRYLESDRQRSVGLTCGFFRLPSTASNPLPPQLEIPAGSGQIVSVANLPVATPQRCLSIGGERVRFTPVNW